MAASTLVGNSIGAENIPLAKKYAAIIMRGAVFVNVTVALVLYLLRHAVTSIYIAETDQDSIDVAKLTVETIPFLCVHLVSDLTQGVQGGIIRGIGLQGKAFLCALVCYYLIGLPIGGCLMFLTDLGLKGSWVGIACSSFCVNFAFAYIINKSPWN